jgi:GTPase SAR1 family protein
MVVVGRQRVGKTSFLNALAQYLQERGAEFAI